MHEEVTVKNHATAENTRYKFEYIWESEALVQTIGVGTRLLYQTKMAWPIGTLLLVAIFLYPLVTAHGGENVRIMWAYLSLQYQPASGEWGSLLVVTVLIFLHTILVLLDFSPFFILKKKISGDVISDDFHGKQVLLLCAGGAILHRNQNEYVIPWEIVHSVKKTKTCLFIFCQRNRFIPIPLTAFEGEISVEEAMGYIESRCNHR